MTKAGSGSQNNKELLLHRLPISNQDPKENHGNQLSHQYTVVQVLGDGTVIIKLLSLFP